MDRDSNLQRYADSNDTHPFVLIITNSSSIYRQEDDGGGDVVSDFYEKIHRLPLFVVMVSGLLGFIILATVVGNVFVVVAITVEKNLRNAANFLIASLAVADLLVAVLVMPIAAVYEVTHKWYLGSLLCDIWTSFDVICCTASILHLVAISLDRYWVVTQIDYICHRSAKRILIMIALSWSVAIIISVPPLFGWKPPLVDPSKCLISQDLGYTVFSTLGAFYVPLISMMIIYYKVYAAAKSRIRKKAFRKREAVEDVPLKVKLRELRKATNKDLDARSDTSSPVIKNKRMKESLMLVTNLTAVGYAATETTTTTVVIAAAAANALINQFPNRLNDSENETPVPDLIDSNKIFSNRDDKIENQSERFESDCEQKTRKPAKTRKDLESLKLTENGESNKGSSPVYVKSTRPFHKLSRLKNLSTLQSSSEICTNFDSVESTEDICRASTNHYKTQISSESAATIAAVESPQSSSSKKFPSRNLTLTGLGKSPKSLVTREQRNKEKIEQKRERKAARTLAIVTGTFIICWLPFFIVATVRPFCKEPRCRYPAMVTSFIGWLGYINSLLNPVIYTIFNPDFRAAFHKLLFKKCFRCRKF